MHWEGIPIHVEVFYCDEVSSSDTTKRFHATIEAGDTLSRSKRTRKCIAAMISEERGYPVKDLTLLTLHRFYYYDKKSGRRCYSLSWDVHL